MALQRQTLRVLGYTEFLRACDHAAKETKKEVRAALRTIGQPVRAEAARDLTAYLTRARSPALSRSDARTAQHFRVIARQRGVQVEQRLGKSKNENLRRRNFGALQMRKALLPALKAKQPETKQAAEQAIDRIVNHFERTAK